MESHWAFSGVESHYNLFTVGSDISLANFNCQPTCTLSTIQKVHKPPFPLYRKHEVLHAVMHKQNCCFNRQPDMHFKYHSESAQTAFSSKGNEKPYRQSCAETKLLQYIPDLPLYNIHKLGISLFRPRDITCCNILSIPHFKRSSWTTYKS
jgi:hypothetical protein